MKNIWIITLFPHEFSSFFSLGVTGNRLKEHFTFHLINLRDFATGNYKTVDDAPYGGGPGAIIRADLLEKAIESILAQGISLDKLRLIFPSPRGKKWDHVVAKQLATTCLQESKDLVFICGRYEGVDERFLQLFTPEEISIGDYVLSGGELAAQIILDSMARYIPGILGNKESSKDDSFETFLLEHPQYTRPRTFHHLEVPEVLTSGHEKNIKLYQQQEKERVTQKYRPDLYEKWLKKK